MKTKTLFLFIGVLLLLTSCMFTEEIYINKNGSGNYAFKMDMSEMLASMGGETIKDSLQKPKVLDTIIFFKDLINKSKDSIAKLSVEDQQLINELKGLKLHMLVNEEKKQMLLDFNLDFKNLAELKNIQKKINKAQALNDKKNNSEKDITFNADVTYSLDKNVFSRNVQLKKLSTGELEKHKKSTSNLEGTYQLIYHFEKDIKSVSYKFAQISADKRTMTIEVDMDTLIKNPKLLEFKVKLK